MVIHPHIRRKSKKEKKGFFDYAIYPIAILSSVMTLPQLYQVWIDRNIEGVSLVTWGSYAALAVLWCFYGLFKKQPPIILGNLCIAILDGLIVIGVLMYSKG